MTIRVDGYAIYYKDELVAVLSSTDQKSLQDEFVRILKTNFRVMDVALQFGMLADEHITSLRDDVKRLSVLLTAAIEGPASSGSHKSINPNADEPSEVST